jgi:hypothetical protein
MSYMLLIPTLVVFLQEVHVFVNSAELAYLAKQSLSYLETGNVQQVFFSKTHSILTGKECARCSNFEHR